MFNQVLVYTNGHGEEFRIVDGGKMQLLFRDGGKLTFDDYDDVERFCEVLKGHALEFAFDGDYGYVVKAIHACENCGCDRFELVNGLDMRCCECGNYEPRED
jgi:hypothetical protein